MQRARQFGRKKKQKQKQKRKKKKEEEKKKKDEQSWHIKATHAIILECVDITLPPPFGPHHGLAIAAAC